VWPQTRPVGNYMTDGEVTPRMVGLRIASNEGVNHFFVIQTKCNSLMMILLIEIILAKGPGFRCGCFRAESRFVPTISPPHLRPSVDMRLNHLQPGTDRENEPLLQLWHGR